MTVNLPRLHVTVDPLIGEAKQRMRRRRLLLAALLAGVIALAVALTLALRPFGSGSFRGRYDAWVPPGVQEIDVRSPTPDQSVPPMSLRVTDPSNVERIVAWFNGLTGNSHAPAHTGCAGGFAANVVFTFRGASGNALATANSSPGATGYCDPIHFVVRGQPEDFLYDANRANSLIGRVQELLGVKFQVFVYLG